MYAAIDGYAGSQPFNDWFIPDSVQRMPLGTKITAVDPVWGLAEFVYFQANEAIAKGSAIVFDELGRGTNLPSVVTQGFPWAVSISPGILLGQYGWGQVTGRAVYRMNATVAADGVVAIAASGILGASVTGKQLLGIRHRVPQTATKTFASTNTQAGTGVLFVPGGYDGVFVGMQLAGTGIPGGTVAAGLDPDGKRIYTGSAINTFGDRNSTATGQITLTGTYSGYGSGVLFYPSCMQIVT
jgi:hypothetical protein